MDPAFKAIAKLFERLPGIGPRAASRMVLALLDRPQAELDELGTAICELKNRVRQCHQCHNLSDDSLCVVCRDSRRTAQSIMVVEKVTDLESVERAGIWKGVYHVLGGAISPVDGINPEQLRIRELAGRADQLLQEVGSVEIVLATNPTASGEMTAMYIRDLFSGMRGVRITRLGRGLATGTHLEYADEITLRHALESRK
ncbi:MAG TPA: recombination mediator RecR [Candidatus Paceibacterota bacterium]|nr:recombination mediator RecR [Candidatus Paceibacterota bacterium]